MVVYHGPNSKTWEQAPKPVVIDDTDAIVTNGRILGHEAVGTVESVGTGVKNVKPGDRVLISCITACGTCRFCRDARYGQCTGGGGWILGHLIDGTQAAYVRVPFADTSTYPVPAGASDDEILMLADVVVNNSRDDALAAVMEVTGGPVTSPSPPDWLTLHPNSAATDHRWATRRCPVRHPPLRDARHDRGLRHVRWL